MLGDRTKRVRGIGWEYVHVAIDDCTRVGYAEVLADEQGDTTAGFFARAYAWYAAHGITMRRLLTDNGGNYRSAALGAACNAYRIRHYVTRPYRPQTNGKAERFIRALLHERAYAQACGRSRYRTRALSTYRLYNTERRHTALQILTPLQFLAARQCTTSSSTTTRGASPSSVAKAGLRIGPLIAEIEAGGDVVIVRDPEAIVRLIPASSVARGAPPAVRRLVAPRVIPAR